MYLENMNVLAKLSTISAIIAMVCYSDVAIQLAILLAFIGIIYYYNNITTEAIPKYEKVFVAPGWEKVADTFRIHIDNGKQRGGAFSVYYKGKLVVDVYGGYADEAILQEWTKDTVSQFFSTTKAMGGIVMAMLVDRGLLDYNAPVAKYWPEFAQNGKENITVEQLLSHQAGLPIMDEPYDFLDIMKNDKKISRIYAAQKPVWKIGEGYGYHGLTLGVYEDQLVKRIDPKGRSLSQFFHEEIAIPLDLDFFIGLPKEEHYRCARNVNAKLFPADYISVLLYKFFTYTKWGPDTLFARMIKNPPDSVNLDVYHNRPETRQVPLVSTQGFGTTRAVAKLFGTLANGGKHAQKVILSENVIKQLQESLTSELGLDFVLKFKVNFGRGVSVWPLPQKQRLTFGAKGAGGQIGMADLDKKLGVSYLTNHLFQYGEEPRCRDLIESVYKTLQEIE